MESEEAIMENENNSNVESESNIRDREQKEAIEELLDSVTSYATEPQDLTPEVVLQEQNESDMPAEDSNTAMIAISGSSNPTINELIVEDYGEQNENKEEIAPATALASVVGEDIPDYEDFIGGNESSQNKEKFSSAHSDDNGHEPQADEEQKCKESSNIGPKEEEMEVDDFSVDHIGSSSAAYSEHRYENQQGVNDVTDPTFQAQQLDNQEKKLKVDENVLHASETSEEAVDMCEKTQSGSVRNINELPDSATYWDDDIDLLGEDSGHEDMAAEEDMLTMDRTIPVLSPQQSANKNVSVEHELPPYVPKIVENTPVSEESLERPPEVEMIEQGTRERVTSNSLPETASLASFLPKDVPELLKDKVNSSDDTSYASLAQPVASLNNSYIQSGEKDSEDLGKVMFHAESVAPLEESMDITHFSDKAFSDTNVAESLNVADYCMAEDAIDDNQNGEILSVGDHMPEEKITVEDFEVSGNAYKPAVDSDYIRTGTDEAERGHVSKETDSECGLTEANFSLEDAISNIAESAVVAKDVISPVIDSGIISLENAYSTVTESGLVTEKAVSEDIDSDIVTEDAERGLVAKEADSECDLGEAKDTLEVDITKVAESSIITEDTTAEVIESDIFKEVAVSKVTELDIATDDTLVTEPGFATSEKAASEVTDLGIVMDDSLPTVTVPGIVTAEELTIVTAEESGIVTAEKLGIVTAEESDIVTAEESGIVTAEKSGIVTAEESGIVTAEKSGIVTAEESGIVTENEMSTVTGSASRDLDSDNLTDDIVSSVDSTSAKYFTSSEQPEQLTFAHDKNGNSEGVREGTTDLVNDIINVFGNHTANGSLKQISTNVNVTQDKNVLSEENEMEITKENFVNTESSFHSLENSLITSSEHQKDTPLNIGVEKGIIAVEECMESSKLESEERAMDVEICQDMDQSYDKNSADLLLEDAKSSQTVSESIEAADKKSLSPKTDKKTESANEPSESTDDIADLPTMETSDESVEKENTAQDINSIRESSSLLSPAKDIESQNAVAVSEIKAESGTSNLNKPAEGKHSASTRSVKQDRDISKTENSIEDKVVDVKEAKVVPVKNEAAETNVVENGVNGKDPPVVDPEQKQLVQKEEKSPVVASKGAVKREPSKRSSKSKMQTCLVCQKICKCKYNIVRNGDTKHLCDDACFKQFRNTPSVFLKSNENTKASKTSSTKRAKSASAAKDVLALYQKEMASRQSNNYKTCTMCQLLNLNESEPYCNWKGLDFCGESCLGKFQANLNTSCSFCHAYIPIDMRTTCCVKIGNDMRPFCKQRCYNEFKKKLRLCSFCQRDLAGISAAFTAMVGSEGKFKEFCSQSCMKNLENEMTDLEICVAKSGLKQETITCSICKKNGSLKYTVQLKGKGSKLCSDQCLSALKFTNKINLDTCDNCGVTCTAEEAQAHFVQFEGQLKRFCSDNCVNVFRKANSKVVQCGWCVTKKLNFDMIEKQDSENKIQMFCSLNCLSLYRVNLQAKSGQTVPCDQCLKVESAQYHLTMSDASVRNFCSYTCVMTFQSHFATKNTSLGSGPASSAVPSPQLQPQQSGHLPQQHQPQRMPMPRSGRMNTRQATRQQSPTFPVISNVVSLATQGGEQKSQMQPSLQTQPQVPPQAPPLPLATPPKTTAAKGNIVPSADGKHQILIQAAPVKFGKNKSLQCRPVTQTKSTSCKPVSQTKETQTDETPPKCMLVPIPVPVYIPMPTVMFTAPAPKIVPFPIPVPVPIFIPTTRKSVNGITKTIQEIVERMPADPLEAELLMMAEAVAADRRPGDSDTDSETDNCTEDFTVPVEDVVMRPMPMPREDESLMMRKREGQGEEDMIQMALRMAEEMSGPIEDLETSVEPVAISTEAPPAQQNIQSFENQVDEEYNPSRANQHRVTKRASRGRPPPSRVKRQRIEDDSMQPEPSVQLQSMEPPPDAHYRLKFTYGVNAWRHWIVSKNAQIEKMKQATGSYRLRAFSTDILKCTTDELNHTLCMFIREVRKPNGGEYSPDSIYYLCLGIQQYLYENGRIENIFTDSYFDKFTNCLNDILKTLQPKVNSQGQMLCRIEEEHLWESKQLGAHSPFILLNTLIYFHTKHFILKTAQEHMALSFAQILKHWKKGMPLKGHSAASGKNISLRFYCLANGKKDGLAARKNKDGIPVYEVTENFDNPLRCPVKLYEFFLSKCPESIKNRNDIFYPLPECSCVPDSPVWYSTQSIDIHTMDKMLTRVLLVREIQEAHLHAQPIY